MAEWLRRWTLNLMGALRAGSIPSTGDFFSLFFFYDDGGALSKARALMQMRSMKPEGAK